MKKSILHFSFLLGLLICSSVKAQMPRTLPLELLDKNSSVFFMFGLNETPDQKKAMMDQFSDYLLKEGFNLVKVEERKNNMTEAEKAKYKKDNDSLQITYEVVVLTSGFKHIIWLYQWLPTRSVKQYEGGSFAQCFGAFNKALTEFKSKNPGMNQAPYDPSVLKGGSMAVADSTAEEDDEEGPVYTFTDEPTFIDELPKDLDKSNLVVMLYDEMEVSPEDTNKISKDELQKRRERTARLKNKNAKYKERFKEYPYPIIFALPKDLASVSEKNPYMLVDRQRKGMKTTETTTKATTQGIRTTTMSHHNSYFIYHNFSIRDNRKSNTYYRLTKWIDCEKGGEIFCLKRFIKGVINADAE